jgi:hypothetical protein
MSLPSGPIDSLNLRSFVLILLIINAVVGVFIFIFPETYAIYGRFFFALGSFVFFMTMWFVRDNLLFQTRLLLLVTIGYFAGLVKAIDPSAAFSPVEIRAQTLEIGAQMFGLTSIALLGAFFGFEAGFGRRCSVAAVCPGSAASLFNSRAFFYLSTIIILITGFLSARSYGDSVFESGYASGSGEGQLLGSLQSIGVIAMVIAVNAGSRLNRIWVIPVLLLLGLYYFYWAILIRGGRTEVMSGFLAVFVAFAAAKGRIASFKTWHFIAFIILVIFMEAWGTLRSTLSLMNRPEETVVEGYIRLLDLGIYHAGTISGIATTFSNSVHIIENSVASLDLGKSYFDYLLRTPPEFLYPDRPQDLAWMFPSFGYAAIGGMFELAEAFYNFGLIGCLVVPFIVSFVIGRSYMKAMKGGLLWLFILASILAATFRGAWYQTFAYYKTIVTGVVLYFFYVSIINILRMLKSKNS